MSNEYCIDGLIEKMMNAMESNSYEEAEFFSREVLDRISEVNSEHIESVKSIAREVNFAAKAEISSKKKYDLIEEIVNFKG